MICFDAPVLRRLLTISLGALATVLSVLVGLPAHAAAAQPPDCPPPVVKDNARVAKAIFTGTVTAVEKQPRPDALPGANYLQTVTVDLVYTGPIRTETVQVQTDRDRASCSLGALQMDTEYMFFVSGTGEPWVASGTSGTTVNSEALTAEIEALRGQGEPPIEPTPEHAVFTPVDTDDPQSLSRTAAPGAALVIVGLLGLVVVGAVRRRL